MIALRNYQQSVVDDVRSSYRQGFKCPLVVASTGSGKCLGKGTPILMFDGTIKPVEDVVVGDLLMGPDSNQRRVESLARGHEMMYRVTPVKGDSYVVNESHILSLKISGTGYTYGPDGRRYTGGDVANVTVLQYLAATETFRHRAKGWRAPANFRPAGKLPLPPYILGAWLGDGTTGKTSFTTGDTLIANEFSKYAKANGMKFRVDQNSDWSVIVHMYSAGARYGRGGSPFGNALRALGIFKNKRIPHIYKTASRKDRLEMLAGVIDTDGYNSGKGFDLTLKSEDLLDDVIFVARSLGFSCYKKKVQKKCHNNGVVGEYWSCHINGDIDQVPCRLPRKKAKPRRQKKSQLVTGIKVEAIGDGEYFGFQISGNDRLFMLGDFTVTHNTVMFSYITQGAAKRGNPVLIAAHRKEIIRQISLSLARFGVEHQVIAAPAAVRSIKVAHFKAFGRSFVSASATTMVGSVQTMVGRFDIIDATLARVTAASGKPAKLLVVMDEGHHVVQDTQWGKVMDRYPDALGLIVTASPERLDGRGLGKGHGGYADTMIEAPPMSWMIESGFLSPYRIFTAAQQIDLTGVRTRMGDFVASELQERVDKPTVTGDAIQHYQRHAAGMRAVVFCVSISHSEHVAAEFEAAGIASAHIDGSIDDAARDKAITDFADGKVMVLTQVNLVSEGFDLGSIAQKDVTIDCIIDLAPTESLVNAMQRWGRALRPAPGKTAIILDHAGNVLRHGLPDEDRQWSLEGRKKSKRKAANDNEPDVKISTCTQCFAVHAPAPECPVCGHVYPIKERKVEQQDGDLQELTDDAMEALRRQKRAMQGQAQSVEALVAQGISRFRAVKIIEAREAKAALISGIVDALQAHQQKTGMGPYQTCGHTLMDVKRMKPKELRELQARLPSLLTAAA